MLWSDGPHPYRTAALGCGVTASAMTAFAVAARREVLRARQTARLVPPVTHIDTVVAPPAPTHVGARPEATGADAPATGAEAPAAAADDGARPLRLAALGDSAIAGVGARYVDGCLPVQLALRVAAACGRRVHVRSHGVSGARTVDVTDLQVSQLDADDPPDVIVVVVGTNDVSRATAPWRYRRDVARLHDRLRDHAGAPVVYCSLPDFRVITVVAGPVRMLAVVYGRLLGALQQRALRDRPGAVWVDALHEAGPDFLSDPAMMSADGYHPSEGGYARMADVLAPAVAAAVAMIAER